MSKWKRFLLLGSLSVVLLAGLMFTSHTKMSTAHATGCNTVAEGFSFINSEFYTAKPTWGNNCTTGQGNISNFVYAIQVTINEYGACNAGTPDGIFGQNTFNAVECFQRYFGLTVDGVVGQQTWRALAGVVIDPPGSTIGYGWNYFYVVGDPNNDFRMWGVTPYKWYVHAGGCWRQVNFNSTACE